MYELNQEDKMANNYQQMSMEIEKPTTQELAWLNEAMKIWDEEPDDDGNEQHPIAKKLGIPPPSGDFSCGIEHDGKGWFHMEEGGDLDSLVLIFQAFLKKFRPKKAITFSWSFTCSRPRLGEFGGGSVVITAKKSYFVDAQSWAYDKFQSLKKRGVID